MNRGINTEVGEEGILFSGGQRQRLALARSFYFGRDIIVFDEATSALDKDTEAEIIKAIEELRGEATILFISHNEQPPSNLRPHMLFERRKNERKENQTMSDPKIHICSSCVMPETAESLAFNDDGVLLCMRSSWCTKRKNRLGCS